MFTRRALCRAEVFEALAVKFTDPGFGADPDVSAAILVQRDRLLLRQPLVYREMPVGQPENLLSGK